MRPTIVAHRGGGGTAPENTLAAFRRTISGGVADAVEFDVQRSRDGELMVFHDADLRRTTNVGSVFPERSTSPIGEFDSSELKQLDCGFWFYSDAYSGETMPTLEETLAVVAGKIRIHLELKHPHRYPGVEVEVAMTLREHDLVDPDAARVTSFELDSLRRLHNAAPEITLAAAIRDVADLERSGLADVVASVGIAPQYTARDKRQLEEWGLPLSTGTPNSPRRMREALDDRIGTITTDYPEVLDRMIRGLPPFTEDPSLVIEEVLIDPDDPGKRRVSIRNLAALDIDCTGWYLWNGVRTPILLPEGRLRPGRTFDMPLERPRGRDVSSIQALALHDAEHAIVDLFEYWAVRRPQ